MRGTVIHIQPIGARTPMTPTERCPIEGKLRFETRKDAETTIEAWHEEHGWIGRPYYCRSCDGFHLTRNPEPERSPA